MREAYRTPLRLACMAKFPVRHGTRGRPRGRGVYFGHTPRWVSIASMNDSLNSAVLLFSYGTLQDEAVHLANFGRELTGSPDLLPGYSMALIAIRDPAVVATSGKAHHSIAERSANLTDEVPGIVFEITAEELAAADRYEVSEYTRVCETLKSGARAWVYVRA
jgi:hypothetical protein